MLAGVIAAADITGADASNAGLWLERDAILAVVIGGTSLFGGRFSLVLAATGALIIRAMNTGILVSGYPPELNLPAQSGSRTRGAAAAVAAACRRREPCRALAGGESMRRLPPAIITAIVLVAGFAICTMQFPHIASTRVVANLLTDNAFLGIVATGMTFVIISGGINLPVGSVIGFAFIAVQQAMIAIARRSAVSKAGATP